MRPTVLLPTALLLASLLPARSVPPSITEPLLPGEAAREREIARLRATVEARPKDVGSWHDLAVRLREARRWDEAIEAESQAIAGHSKYAVAFYGRGTAKMEKRDYAAARSDFTTAIGLWEGRNGVEWFTTVERPRDEHVQAYRDRGIASAHEGRFAEAIDDLAIALRLRADDPRLLFEKAHVEEKGGRKPDAVADFRRAGLVYAEGGSVREARECRDRLVKLGAQAEADAIEKRLEPPPRGSALP